MGAGLVKIKAFVFAVGRVFRGRQPGPRRALPPRAMSADADAAFARAQRKKEALQEVRHGALKCCSEGCREEARSRRPGRAWCPL